MTRKVAARSCAPKSRHFLSGNQISPVMQKVRGLLPAPKSAPALQELTGEPLSICQKVLSGDRVENRDMLLAIGRRTPFAGDVFLAMTDGNPHPRAQAAREAVELALLEFDHQEMRRAVQARRGRS